MNRLTIVPATSAAVAGLVFVLTCAFGAEDRSATTAPAAVKAQPPDEVSLFFPSKYPAGNWAPRDLRYEDVWFTAEDNTKLHGWYCPADNPRATVLIAHGNAGHVASRANWLKYLQTDSRVSVFLFDYRGYGRSEGVPTVEGALMDARAARAKLRELAGIEDSEMVLMGESLGGAVVVQLAAESAPRGLIIQSTFSALKELAELHYPHLAHLVPRDKLDSATQIARYRGPLLQSHGTADRTIPIAYGEKLFRAANEPKTLIRLPRIGHNDWATDQYLTRMNQFIQGLPPKAEAPSNTTRPTPPAGP